MKYLLILSVLLLSTLQSTSAGTKVEGCHGLVFRNVMYEPKYLTGGLDAPTQLVVDHNTNTLFFSDDSTSKHFNADASIYMVKGGNSDISANAVDNKLHEVYFGGKGGLSKYDYNSKSAVNLNITGNNVVQLFFKEYLYYTNQDEKAYMIKNGKKMSVPGLETFTVRVLAVDKDDNIYFSNGCGLFEYKKSLNKVLYVGDYKVNGFSADTKGNLYFSAPEGLFYINEQEQVEQIDLIEDTRGLALCADDSIIYAAEYRILKLKKTNITCALD